MVGSVHRELDSSSWSKDPDILDAPQVSRVRGGDAQTVVAPEGLSLQDPGGPFQREAVGLASCRWKKRTGESRVLDAPSSVVLDPDAMTQRHSSDSNPVSHKVHHHEPSSEVAGTRNTRHEAPTRSQQQPQTPQKNHQLKTSAKTSCFSASVTHGLCSLKTTVKWFTL